MMKKLMLILLLIGMIPMVIAENQLFNANNQIDIKFICYSTTENYCGNTASCNLTLFYPNGTIILNGVEMENKGTYHNYTINPTYTNGIYPATTVCCESGVCKSRDFNIEVTETGEIKPSGIEILIVSIILILLLIFMLFIFIWNFEHLVKGDTNIKDVGISISYYFALLAFALLNKIFFNNNEIGNWAGYLITWTQITHIYLPLFGFAWNFFFGQINKARRAMR